MVKQVPRLFISPLTNMVYIGLSYKEQPDGSFICSNKVNVTEQFEDIMKDYKVF
jgi:hypothetical protein